MKLKKFALTIILLFAISFITGCWDSTELNQLGFTTAYGFDKVDDEMVITLQVLNPHAIAAQKPTTDAPVVVYVEKGKSILEIMRRISTKSPRRLTGIHMHAVIFGEDFAKCGISEVMDYLLRHYHISPDLYFAIAEGTTANDVLTNLTKLESIPSVKINSALQISEKTWAGAKVTKLIELANLTVSDGNSPVISGIDLSEEPPTKSTDDLKTAISDPINFNENGVFKKDKLVGWLNEDESKGYNYIIGNVPNTVGYVESEETGKVTMIVKTTKKNTKIVFLDNKPSAFVNIDLVGIIENINSGFDITKEENLKIIEKLSEEKVIGNCEKAIVKAKSLKSDIFGFGDEIHISNPEYWKTAKDYWSDSGFIDLPVTINVKFKITGTASIGKSIISKEK